MKPEEFITLAKTDEQAAATQLTNVFSKLTEYENSVKGMAQLEKQLQALKTQHDAATAKLSVYGDLSPETALEMQTKLQKYTELGDIDTVVGYKKTVTELADLTKKQLEQYQRTLQGKESELSQTKTQATQLNDQLALLQSTFEKQRLEDQKRIEALEQENADAKKQAAKSKVDSTLMGLLAETGVMKELLPGAQSLWNSKAPKLDSNGNVVLVGDNKQHILLKDAIKEWAESAEGKAYRAAPVSTGGSSPQETQKVSLTDESTSKYKYPDGKSWNISAIIAGTKNNDPVAVEMLGQYKKNPAIAGALFTGANTSSLFN
jgi:hypothetical protein